MFNKLFLFLKSTLFLFCIFLVFVSCISGVSVTAADQPKNGLAGFQPSGIKCIFFVKVNESTCKSTEALTTIIQKFLIDIAPAVTTILIIFGGYEYFVDKEAKKTSAQATIFAAISGFIIITLAPIITNVIIQTLNNKEKVLDSAPLIKLLEQIIDVLLNLSSVVAVAVIVLGGYAYFIQFFVNGGKQEGKLNARDLIFGGIMGLIITMLAHPIVNFIKAIIGSDAKGELSLNQDGIVTFIKNILGNFLIPFASIASLIFIIAAAYMWITAGSDEDRVKNAKKFLNNALIGLVIVLLSTVIVQLIVYFVQPSINFIPGGSNANEIIKAPSATPVPSTTNPVR